ncbi:hypothetical protein E2C01_063944 [Portunus trituberculatus]|uniref:Uncharacterized protein n=1 Tax=Portunus trituberculatus TaxID=210409 RepID=A0A5B7HHS9_PORTR|nr:hypothetical protein [Portunus trituberculatus]
MTQMRWKMSRMPGLLRLLEGYRLYSSATVVEELPRVKQMWLYLKLVVRSAYVGAPVPDL